MSEPVETELVGLLAALEVLDAPPAELEARLASGDEATCALRRVQLEALAVLAWSLPPAPTSKRRRDELLARLKGDETVIVPRLSLDPDASGSSVGGAGGRAPAATPPPPSPLGVLDPPAPPSVRGPGSPAFETTPAWVPPAGAAPPVAPVTPAPVAPVAPVAQERPRRPPAPAPAPRVSAGARAVPARPYRWALPLAAVLALAAIGLGYHDWVTWQQLQSTRRELSAARREGAQLAERLRTGGGAPDLAALQEKMRDVDTQLRLVTSPGTAVCALRPSTGGTPAARNAAGLLYVAADHQHWYLRAQNLPSPGEGRAYQLWFLVGERPVAAGSFRLEGNEAVMSSPTMPEGTSAAMITIEPADAPMERPTGPAVLYGKEMAPLL